MKSGEWGSDVAVSLPLPPVRTAREVPMYGFVFTENGLFHDISEADYEAMSTPTFSPSFDPDRAVVYGDE